MRIAVTSTHTPRYAKLAAVTTPNHLAYCERHRYDYIGVQSGEEFPAMLPNDLRRLLALSREYDALFKIETDVVFTNFDILLNDHRFALIAKSCGTAYVYACSEPKGRATINVGTVMFRRSLQTFELLDRLIDDAPLWVNNHNDCYWQNHLGRLIDARHRIADTVSLSAPRAFNATDQTGDPEWTWQPGDFVCHCGGGAVESRIERCKAAMRKAGV